ncbi:vegetative cell wall protein gp1-like [Triticum urartu]|uniref:vegetative cell wall protein gp1-like n=1 Tax=Triticum urartu TaxID=4572 RepID=UPI0020437FB0|nr:vegetative cell wall protein gp1-like [Triticum urartu]
MPSAPRPQSPRTSCPRASLTTITSGCLVGAAAAVPSAWIPASSRLPSREQQHRSTWSPGHDRASPPVPRPPMPVLPAPASILVRRYLQPTPPSARTRTRPDPAGMDLRRPDLSPPDLAARIRFLRPPRAPPESCAAPSRRCIP